MLGENEHYAIDETVRQVSSVFDSFAAHLENKIAAINHHHNQKCTFGGQNAFLEHDYRSAVLLL